MQVVRGLAQLLLVSGTASLLLARCTAGTTPTTPAPTGGDDRPPPGHWRLGPLGRHRGAHGCDVASGRASSAGLPAGACEHEDSFGEAGHGGPQPPPGTGDHDYRTTVYALDTRTADLPERPSADQIERSLEGHVLAPATITGTFGK